MSRSDAWQSLREETLRNLDIRAKYEEFGVVFTGKVSSSGWAECRAIGRKDSNPSAAVNLTTGVYKDFGGGDTSNIFDFMAANGKATSWEDAQIILAKSVGLASKVPKKAKAKRTEDLLGFNKTFVLSLAFPIARKYGIKPEVIEITGARMARYPDKSAEPNIVWAFPVYSALTMLDQPPHSYVLQSTSDQPILVYQGPSAPAKPEKRIVIGHTGILNRFALENWEGAERIYKVEGLSDMLALQNFIPEEYRKKHLVITNACGADDAAPAWELAPRCADKEFIIIHDADIPGQFGTAKDKSGGAQRWIKAIKNSAKVVKNIQLPYEIESKHGKDLRNWLNEQGRTYSDLLKLVSTTKDEVSGGQINGIAVTRQLTPDQQKLMRLNMCVLGHHQGRTANIQCFNYRLRRNFKIGDINRFSFINMLMEFGDDARANVDPNPGSTTQAKLSVQEVKEMIAYEASHRRISRNSAIGVGIWEINGKIVFIGCGEWLTMLNGDLHKFIQPDIEDKLIDFGEETDDWFNEQQIREYLAPAEDVAWRTEFLNEFAGIFRLWDNWANTDEEKDMRSFLMASTVMSMWIQEMWIWRPWIGVTGESNSGKSSFFSFLKSYFGKLASVSSGSSEAGVRQNVGTTARVMLLDELETSHERQKILDWLKGAGAGTTTLRGTPGQNAVSVRIKVLPMFGATEAGMRSETERNRYVLFNMDSRLGKPRFKLPSSNKKIEILRSKSFAIILKVWERAKELNEHLIVNAAISDISARYTEGHSVPCAMWSAIAGHTNEEAVELFNYVMKFMLGHIRFNSEAEHKTLLDEIAHAKVNIGRGEQRTVLELLTTANHNLPGGHDETTEKVLERNGIKKLIGQELHAGSIRDFVSQNGANGLDTNYLFIAHKIVQKELLRGTQFDTKGIDQLLKRVKGSHQCVQKINGGAVRGLMIPLDEILPFESQLPPKDSFIPDEHKINGTPVQRTISEDVF